MQLSPRYGADPPLTLDGAPDGILVPAVRQRRRLVDALASFGDAQWSHPSRCEGWSSKDVIVHLDSTNTFWTHSISAGLRGEPTEWLATFDPVTSPAELVAGAGAVTPAEVLDRFSASTEALVGVLTSLDDDGWSARAEAPPGHLSVSAVAHHALWDSWVHERDILLPLGAQPDEEADEVAAALRYAAALGPALTVNSGSTRRGTFAVSVDRPDLALVVDIGDHVAVRAGTAEADLRLTGDAVEVLEALSLRRALDPPIPAASTWMFFGLANSFDVVAD